MGCGDNWPVPNVVLILMFMMIMMGEMKAHDTCHATCVRWYDYCRQESHRGSGDGICGVPLTVCVGGVTIGMAICRQCTQL
jgi:hypothetical protein